MNKEIKIIGNNAIVVDENKQEKELILTDNLEEILILENNIEYIKNELEKIEFDFKHTKNNNRIIKIITTVALLGIFTTCGILGTTNIVALWTMPFLLGTTAIFSTFVLDINNKYNKNLKAQEKLLKESFFEEINKLNKLKQISKKINNTQDTISKKLNKSEYVKNLKNKLNIITDYNYNKDLYINLYLNFKLKDVLNEKRFSEEDFQLIVSLIENDLQNESKLKKEKTFIKKIK